MLIAKIALSSVDLDLGEGVMDATAHDGSLKGDMVRLVVSLLKFLALAGAMVWRTSSICFNIVNLTALYFAALMET